MVLIAAFLISSSNHAPMSVESAVNRSVKATHKQASIQSWEKRIAPGLSYRMDWDPNTPRIIYAVKLNLKSEAYRPIAELAGKTIFEDNATKGRGTVTQMVEQDQAIVGVNGDFFPFTGDPVSVMVRDGELLSAPYVVKGAPTAHRAAFGWGPGFSSLSFTSMTSTMEASAGSFKIDGWDEEAEPDQITLNTTSAGLARAKAPNTYAVIKTTGAKWAPNSEEKGQVLEVGTDLILRPVPKDTVVLIATGKVKDSLIALKEGETVTFKTHTDGFDWNKVTNVIGGGPVLVKNGDIFVDWAEERFRDDFTKQRHPRTAIGRTSKDELWLVAVDGRSKISAGATLEELAAIMKGLGCVDAMNLDGGGSTAINVLGITMNRPSDGTERPVANGVLILGPIPPASTEALSLPVSKRALTPKDKLVMHVYIGETKKSVRNSEVLWNATGAAWIDQSGTLHLRSAGTIEVTAFVHGQLLRATYQSTGGPPEKANGFSAQD